MSWQGLQWFEKYGRHRCQNAGQFAVLYAIASHVGENMRGCYASTETIAAEAKMSVRSAQRRIDELAVDPLSLIESGDPAVVEHLRADRRPPVWDLARAGRQLVTPSKNRRSAGSQSVIPKVDGVSDCPPRGDNLSATGCQIGTQTISTEPKEQEPKPSPPTPSQPAPDDDSPRQEEGEEIHDLHPEAEPLLTALWFNRRPTTAKRAEILTCVSQYLQEGADVAKLRDHLTVANHEQARIIDAAAVYLHRLKRENLPDDLFTAAPEYKRDPCGDCDEQRQRETADGRIYACPICHSSYLTRVLNQPLYADPRGNRTNDHDPLHWHPGADRLEAHKEFWAEQQRLGDGGWSFEKAGLILADSFIRSVGGERREIEALLYPQWVAA